MNRRQLEKAALIRNRFKNRGTDENLKDTLETLETVYYQLKMIAKICSRSKISPEQAPTIKFLGTKAQVVGDIGKFLEGLHDHVIGDTEKLF